MSRALRIVAWGALVVVVAGVAAIVLAIVYGGPDRPAPLASVSMPFESVDFSDLPPERRLQARDGTSLAYRRYEPAAGPQRGSVVLVHGSSGRSSGVHALAKALASAGYVVYAPDVRGHGDSGIHGRIAYIGQLEDDLADLAGAVDLPRPRSLLGFSAGGGFVLRFTADARRTLFDRVLLLAPFMGQDSPTYRLASGGWASVGLPRIVALVVLNAVGIRRWNDLTVVSYAIAPEQRERLTGDYSYALTMNFRPHQDERADIASADRPMAVVIGADDEQFMPGAYAATFAAAGRPIPVTIVPGVGHIGLTTTPAGVAAVVAALDRLQP